MPRVPHDFDFSGLSPAERLLLAQQLLDSVGDDAIADLCPLTPDQFEEIERRSRAADNDEIHSVPLEVALDALRSM